MDKQRYDKGSYTVEASMIFPLIVFVVLALLFAFLYMQQKAALISAASFAAQQGAELWQDSRRSMENGEVNKADSADSIGYRVFDNLLFSTKTFEGYFEQESAVNGKKKLVLKMDAGDSLPGQKAALIGEALCNRIESTVLKPKNTKLRITYTNNALRGRLSVEIIQEIKVPLGGIKAFFDGKDTLTLSGQSTAAVTEPAEYIRNIDLAIELSKKLQSKLDFQGFIEGIKGGGQK